MTVAVGIVYSRGVVIASDSMGSSGTVASRVDKAKAMSNHPIVWAMSGSRYVIQEASRFVEKYDSDGRSRATPEKLAHKLRPVISDAYQLPSLEPGGSASDLHHHSSEALLAGWTRKGPSLVHLPSDLAPVECSSRTFVAIGAGHEFAAASQATLAHYFYEHLSAEQAFLLAYRVVAAVCSVSSWGVAPPIQMASADEHGARVISARDVEHVEFGVQRWLQAETDGFSNVGPRDVAHDLPSLYAAGGEEGTGTGSPN
ncbi:hypothetical protein [Actinomycetospora aeridis]|uniref:hypothetical protein n=1 Tax=Actinomycetospora aeridis TaxID=3129231 RepID=UPI0035A1B211